jgi:hypothetical protein
MRTAFGTYGENWKRRKSNPRKVLFVPQRPRPEPAHDHLETLGVLGKLTDAIEPDPPGTFATQRPC